MKFLLSDDSRHLFDYDAKCCLHCGCSAGEKPSLLSRRWLRRGCLKNSNAAHWRDLEVFHHAGVMVVKSSSSGSGKSEKLLGSFSGVLALDVDLLLS